LHVVELNFTVYSHQSCRLKEVPAKMSNVKSSVSVDQLALEEIEEKLSKDTVGKVLQEYTNGDFKLSMWIPSDLGK
jgi:hypothetical protein